MSVNRPLRIPGRKFVLTKNKILESQKHTKSNMEAARWLGVSYNTYKKWAKFYEVFEQHLNQEGFGIKKGWGAHKIPLEDVFSGKSDVKYTHSQLKKRMIDEGYFNEECSICNWSEERVTDNLICLKLDFLDGDSKNRSMENMRLLCPNCYLSNNGMFHNSKTFCK
tara:strand:- start:46 stop:543 length:498 start_codon:yes stop_codon:yes gene_type:complete